MATKYKWTAEDNDFLIKNYSTMTLKELSNCLNRRDSTISKHARDVLGLGHKKLPGLVTDREKDYVEANYSTETYSDMAKALGVNINRICSNVDEQRYRDIRSVLKQDKTADVSEILTVKAFDDTEGNATDKVFVNQLMNKYLNENEKKTIKLLFFDDMTHSEAAEVLGVSSSLIRNRKQRALHKMRKGLKVA